MFSAQKINAFINNYAISFFELQFVISLMSLPLLIVWGIPISIMSPLANFIFTPLLILFLWCSCIATIFALVGTGLTVADYSLEAITKIWLHLLSFSRPEWLIGFPYTMLSISLVLCVAIVGMYTYRKPTAQFSAGLLCTIWCALILIRPHFLDINGIKKVGDLPLWFVKIHGKTYLIDHGALCNRKNLYTNFDYSVLPELVRHTGHATIDTVIFCKPSNKINKVADQCRKQLSCTTIMVTPKAHCFKKVNDQFKDDNSIKVIALSSKRQATAKKIAPPK